MGLPYSYWTVKSINITPRVLIHEAINSKGLGESGEKRPGSLSLPPRRPAYSRFNSLTALKDRTR